MSRPTAAPAYESINWRDVFERLNETTPEQRFAPVLKEALTTHICHRDFGPRDPTTVERLIDDAIEAGRLEEYNDGRAVALTQTEYTFPLSCGGLVRIVEQA